MDFLRHADLVGFASATLITSTPLVLAALGGTMSERSGVVNIALEGIMLTSAFAGFAGALATHNLWLAGMVIATIHAVLSIAFLVDQIVSGVVINILAVGITGVFYRTYIQNSTVSNLGILPTWKIPLLSQIPVLGPILFQNQPVTYAMLILVIAIHLVLFNTVWGLRTRAC